ncbi:unnamed protein product [Prorocentrum cordatum]|uniref:Uncharacterized protein n=1 Tax=Prorocentrum cordatum TaxID=2364126 RepID=A0ABN9SZX4_9DINO|nr:unnamed protein product [Polarella glacialis]
MRRVLVLIALRSRGGPGAPPRDFALTCSSETFGMAADALGIFQLRNHLCGMRCGGASDALPAQRRAQEQVFRRGRWAAPSSTRRCATETALLRELEGARPGVCALGDLVGRSFCLVLEKGLAGARSMRQVPAKFAATAVAGSPVGLGRTRRRPAASG